jgi:3D (Asp-Asp-Asp) domain-containing protein
LNVDRRKVSRIINRVVRIIVTTVIVAVLSTLVISLFLNLWFKLNIEKLTDSYAEFQQYHLEYYNQAEKSISRLEEEVDVLTLKTRETINRVYTDTLGYQMYYVTAYSPNDSNQGTTNTTSIGFNVNKPYMEYINICAVDPEIIPLGSVVFVVLEGGREEMFIAGDVGYLIEGYDIDLLMETKEEAESFSTGYYPVKVIKAEELSR